MFSTVKQPSGYITVKKNGIPVFDIVFSHATSQAQRQQQEMALFEALAEANSPRRAPAGGADWVKRK